MLGFLSPWIESDPGAWRVDEAARARKDPGSMASFRALRLNMGVSDVLEAELVDVDLWRRAETADAERSGEWVLGVDLGGGAAMSAVAGYWIGTGRLECWAAFPEEPSLVERGRLDGVDGLYVDMVARGELIQVGQHAVDLCELLAAVREAWGKPSASR